MSIVSTNNPWFQGFMFDSVSHLSRSLLLYKILDRHAEAELSCVCTFATKKKKREGKKRRQAGSESVLFSPRDRSGSRSKAQSAAEAPAVGRRRLATPRCQLCSPGSSSSSGSAAKSAATAIKSTHNTWEFS